MKKSELNQAVKMLRSEYGEDLATDPCDIGWELTMADGFRTFRLRTLDEVRDRIRSHRIDRDVCLECDEPTFRAHAAFYCELHYYVYKYQRGYRAWSRVEMLRSEIEKVRGRSGESLYDQARIMAAQREIERRGDVA